MAIYETKSAGSACDVAGHINWSNLQDKHRSSKYLQEDLRCPLGLYTLITCEYKRRYIFIDDKQDTHGTPRVVKVFGLHISAMTYFRYAVISRKEEFQTLSVEFLECSVET